MGNKGTGTPTVTPRVVKIRKPGHVRNAMAVLNLLAGAAGGNAPFRSLYSYQAERQGARRAMAPSGLMRYPEGFGLSGASFWPTFIEA